MTASHDLYQIVLSLRDCPSGATHKEARQADHRRSPCRRRRLLLFARVFVPARLEGFLEEEDLCLVVLLFLKDPPVI